VASCASAARFSNNRAGAMSPIAIKLLARFSNVASSSASIRLAAGGAAAGTAAAGAATTGTVATGAAAGGRAASGWPMAGGLESGGDFVARRPAFCGRRHSPSAQVRLRFLCRRVGACRSYRDDRFRRGSRRFRNSLYGRNLSWSARQTGRCTGERSFGVCKQRQRVPDGENRDNDRYPPRPLKYSP